MKMDQNENYDRFNEYLNRKFQLDVEFQRIIDVPNSIISFKDVIGNIEYRIIKPSKDDQDKFIEMSFKNKLIKLTYYFPRKYLNFVLPGNYSDFDPRTIELCELTLQDKDNTIVIKQKIYKTEHGYEDGTMIINFLTRYDYMISR